MATQPPEPDFGGYESMDDDFMKRGYLLPEGCKDLIDALRLKQVQAQIAKRELQGAHLLSTPPAYLDTSGVPLAKLWKPPPPIKGEITVSAQTSVAQLAELIGEKPIRIIAELMQDGVFASATQLLDFETISRIARKFGFITRKAA
jgi:hypothetical protein